MSRFWQAFNTRYNVYYNGETNYIEQLHAMETEYDDDYSRRVLIHPAEAHAIDKATKPKGSFDRTIEKMQKAIQLHSIKKRPKKNARKSRDPKYKEWMKREEYNPFLHNAWLMMGKAQYMKGDFASAAATFRYTASHFKWLPNVVTESQLWEVRSYCAMGWLTEADNVFTRIKRDSISKKSLRSQYDLTAANFYIKSRRDSIAIPYLANAVKGSKGAQKVRLRFLLGQLYAETGNNAEAYRAFNSVAGATGATYRTRFNARIKQSAVFAGDNINGEVRSLRKMTRFDRNKDYLDQIYYAIGNLYLSRRDTANAISNYVLAAQKSTRNGVDKAISQLTLGGIYFAQHNYADAQPCYAEAVPLITEDYPNYKLLKRRSDVLDELAVYAQNVKLQDSLLTLSQLSEEEQMKVAQRLVDELKKKEKEAEENAKREEYLAEQAAKGNVNGNTQSNAPTTFQMNNDKSWYFYNTATKNAGKTAFQKQWGSRKLEDDWRRRNKATFSMDEFEADGGSEGLAADSLALSNDSTAVDAEQRKKEEDPHFVEYYLKQIPKTDEERSNCNDIIQEGLYNMAVILKDKMEDFPASITEFNRLLTRYPDNVYRLDSYYNLYLMYMRMDDTATAENYRNLIVTDFAESAYGQAMRDPAYFDNLRNMQRDQEAMYERAYDAYVNNRNDEVHAAYKEMNARYPLSKIIPKFMFIDALSYVTEKRYDEFKSTLKEMLERYPETDMTPMASSILKQMAQGRQPNGGSTNLRGMLWSTRLTNDTTATGAAGGKLTPFSNDKNREQYYVFAYPTDTVSANVLLFAIARHNFNAFVVKDFDLEQMTFGRMGLLIVKGFANFDELSHYKSVLEADTELQIPPEVRHVLISVDNFKILLNEGRSLEEYFEFLEGNTPPGAEEAEEPENADQPENAEQPEAAAGEQSTDENGGGEAAGEEGAGNTEDADADAENAGDEAEAAGDAADNNTEEEEETDE